MTIPRLAVRLAVCLGRRWWRSFARDEAACVGETISSLLRQIIRAHSTSSWSTTRAGMLPPRLHATPRRHLPPATA